MRNDLTDITLVIDRSGSMTSCQLEAQNGINHFIEEQKAQDSECLFTLVQFDTEYEFVENGTPIADVKPYTLEPRGMTALNDAVGRAITETGSRLAAIAEEDRPGLVIFVVVTDGLNNASHEFTAEQVRGMIEKQEKKYSWKFLYLGANQDAFKEGGKLGVRAGCTTNYAESKTNAAIKMSSTKVAEFRACRKNDLPVADCAFTDEERATLT
jgi:uncharacterized protein YegL